MKKLNLPLFFIAAVIFLSSASIALSQGTNTIQFRTYVPPPVNTFNRLILKQQLTPPTNCEDGTVYLNSSYELSVCFNSSVSSLLSPWSQESDIVYLRNSQINHSLNVGIDTQMASQRFVVEKDNAQSGKRNRLYVDPVGTDENTGLKLITEGVPTSPNSYKSNYILFTAGEGVNRKTGGIYYLDRRDSGGTAWATPNGIVMKTDQSVSTYDLLIGRNENVGINFPTNASPQYRLDIGTQNGNGNLRVHNVYFTTITGTNKAELKAVYNGGSYYAVLAP